MKHATGHELLERAGEKQAIGAILGAAAQSRAEVYLVGGTIRDLILGRAFLDVDLGVDGDVLRLAAAIGRPEEAESRFGTLRVAGDGCRYDIARTRSEHYPHPGALPEVAPAGIEADLNRRDFTVNALALGLAGARAGELIAAPGALDDLESGRLAVLHDRSFLDDPTRLLRLARYAARLRFEPEPHTRRLATEAIEQRALDTISATRIGNELRLLAAEADPIGALEAVSELGLPWAIDATTAREALAALPADGRRQLLVLSLALADEDGEDLDAMGFTAAERGAILEARGAHALARLLAGARSNSEIARTVGTAGIETVAIASTHGAASQSRAWLQDLRHRRLDITGDDLIANGIRQGPAVGEALARARDAMMDGGAPDRASQLGVALQAAQ